MHGTLTVKVISRSHFVMDKSSLRTSAFVAITLATVSITTCLLAFPMLFHFVQRMEAEAQAEIDWCYTTSKGMWKSVSAVREVNGAQVVAHKQAEHAGRQARAVFFQVTTTGCECIVCVIH